MNRVCTGSRRTRRRSLPLDAGPGNCKELVEAHMEIQGGYNTTYWSVKHVTGGGWQGLVDLGRRVFSQGAAL